MISGLVSGQPEILGFFKGSLTFPVIFLEHLGDGNLMAVFRSVSPSSPPFFEVGILGLLVIYAQAQGKGFSAKSCGEDESFDE